MAELLARLSSQIASVRKVDEAKALRDKAEALRVYYRQQKHCKHIEREATIIRLRAERQIGKLLSTTVKRGNPKLTQGKHCLPEGISQKQSSNWQLVAKLPQRQFEELLESNLPTTKQAVHLARQYVRLRENAKGADSGGNVLTGDMRQLHRLEDDSVDLFLSDPPYADLGAYSRLAELAAAKLKPGGVCAAYSGTMTLPTVMELMGEHLTYYWTFSLNLAGRQSRINARRIMQSWKPILFFVKGKPIHDWIVDSVQGGGRLKERHDWEQAECEAAYLIEKLTRPGQLVVDPYCGSGTVLAAAKRLKRSYLGCELNANTARGARRRLGTL